MLDIFSTREIATGTWLIIFVFFVFVYPKTRKPAIQFARIACSKQLLFPFIVMLVYALILVRLFTLLPIWKTIYMKDIIIWVLFIGVPLCFQAVSEDADSTYFKNMLLSNLKLAILVEYLISSFTFSLIAELILLPVLSLLFMLDAVASTDDKYMPTKKVLSSLLGIIGLVILVCTLKNAIDAYADLGIADLLISFFIPIVFSVLYIPIAYSFAIYAKYQIVFVRMGFREPNDKRVKRRHRLSVIKECGLSYKRICTFEKEFAHKMYVRMSTEEFDDLLERFRAFHAL